MDNSLPKDIDTLNYLIYNIFGLTNSRSHREKTMSLACRECGKIGCFNTLIIFHSEGKFDPSKPISRYSNFYTDCVNFDDFTPVEKSRFMIVQERKSQDSWNRGSDGDLLSEAEYKLISEETLRQKLPITFSQMTC
jgi:hypothetical protein